MNIAVLLSGGVDSSVALHLARRQAGHRITAFYLKIWLEDELAFLGECPWQEDTACARAVCEQAGVPLEVVSLQTEYHERVVAHVLQELKQGRTPSPDLLCNEWIKFGLFFDRIDPGFEKVVSGHYAQIEPRDGLHWLKRSPDRVKDQTYFLSRLSQHQLSRLWFPVGPLTKPQVRALAREWNLPNRDRKDSQGICFLGQIKYPDFVRYHLGEQAGDIIDLDTGRKLGEHRGLWFHTVGQRKSLGLAGGPWYVVNKEMPTHRLYVAHADRYLKHARRQFTVDHAHWIAGVPTQTSLQAKLRHSPHVEPCTIRPLGGARWEVVLEHADPGIAPGQSAVFYQGDWCLGSGVIE